MGDGFIQETGTLSPKKRSMLAWGTPSPPLFANSLDHQGRLVGYSGYSYPFGVVHAAVFPHTPQGRRKAPGYIPRSVAALAINEFCVILGGKLGLDNGIGEALMASRLDIVRTVDQRPELQQLVEQLVVRIVHYFTDQDCDCM